MHALFVLGSCEELQGAIGGERETKVSCRSCCNLDRIGLTAMHACKT